MKVHCIANSGNKLSPKHFVVGYSTSSAFDLTLEKEYIVYGIALWRELLAYLIVGDHNRPIWCPSDLFNAVNSKLPTSWHFAFFGQNEEPWLNAVWGYEELMSTEHYEQITDLDPQALEIFWKRKLEMEDLP